MTRVVALLSLLALMPHQAPQQAPVFRGNADAVVVDVSVTDGRRPVHGLTRDDFALLEDGVPQPIDDVTAESASLDISLLLDVSGSVAGAIETRLLAGGREVVGALQPADHTELITIDRQVRRTTDAHDWTAEVPPRLMDGGTRLFDGIVAAAMERVSPGRRHMIVALTDGIDSASTISRADRLAILARSNAVVHLVAVLPEGRTSGFMTGWRNGERLDANEEGDYDYLLNEITEGTGGRFFAITPTQSFIGPLKEELDFFRTYYVLRYRPTGGMRPGWHTLAVHLTRSHHDVHSRTGYFGR